MIDQYLWDKRGVADAETEELERLLHRFASAPPDASWRPPAARSRPAITRRWIAVAASLVVACSAALWRTSHIAEPWPVRALEGTPTAAAHAVTGAGRLAVGDWLETDATSRATLAVSTIGRVDVEPQTRLQLAESREGTHRLSLIRGRVRATIWAPPGQFIIDTPGARAVDLGCIYSLQTAADGTGVLEVEAGWVALAHEGREVFIPAGARVLTRAHAGPGTPHRSDAPADLIAALSALDFDAFSPGARRAALGRVLHLARRDDAVSLWHLLASREPSERGLAYDALARLVPPPPGVSREGIVAGTRTMRDAWWDRFELGDAATWREWQRRWQ